MNKIQETIKSFLNEYDLNKSDLVYLVAFSGGFDSMCLLDGLRKVCKNKFTAIHLNHKWRGVESDLEEENCKNFCNLIGVDFYSEDLSPDVAKTETAARDARYEFFEKCSKKFNSNIIFTAHNKNDNAETLIYRICTGTGIPGLQGISKKRGKFYRPLLDISREDIEKYCSDFKLKPNNDSSNSDTKYKRNFIRAEILPLLEKIHPDAIDKINSLAACAIDENEICEEYLNQINEKITTDGKINTKKFIKLSTAVQKKIIYNIFIKNNLDYDRKKIANILDFIKENSELKSGKTCSLTSDLWVFTNKEFIEIIDKNKQSLPHFQITKEGIFEENGYIFEIEKFTKPVIKFSKDTDYTAYVNLSRLNPDLPLEIRSRQDGDIIKPFGLDGTQKLKKYLNAKKIPNHEKDNLLFLACENEILWAIGLGISEKIKVTNIPTHRLKFYKKEK